MPEVRDVLIHADESCLGNQFKTRSRPGGAGGLVEVRRRGRWVRRDYWTSEPDTTNNRMALRSAIEALKALREPCHVAFHSDSAYLVRGMSEWIRGWKARGWRRKGGPIENLDLWKALDRLAERHDVRWTWVKGHADHARNEYAHYLATEAAKNQDGSGGLVESGFEVWLAGERERSGRFDDFDELAPMELSGRD